MDAVIQFGIFLVLWLAIYLFIRKDFTKNRSLTKKGFIKLIVSMIVGAGAIATYIVIKNN